MLLYLLGRDLIWNEGGGGAGTEGVFGEGEGAMLRGGQGGCVLSPRSPTLLAVTGSLASFFSLRARGISHREGGPPVTKPAF